MILDFDPSQIRVPCFNQTTDKKCNGSLKLMFARMKGTKLCSSCRDVVNPVSSTFRSKTWGKRNRPLSLKHYDDAWEKAESIE